MDTLNNHEQFMRYALEEGRTALEEGEFPVGCVLTDRKRILVRARRKNSSGELANELDHAEVLALRQLLAEKPDADCGGLTAYSTMEPCLMCFATLLLSGVRRFVWAYEDVMGGGTGVPLARLTPLYASMRVEIVPHVLRVESHALFREFFQRHAYWRDSLLAAYTLGGTEEQS